MAHYLVIVESPAKVKTIKKFLGSNYTVAASQGHVRDLPKSQLGIDVENDYEPKYITIRGKGEILATLRKEAKKSDKVYLATDPDREGEAISWHLAAALKLDEKKMRRITFNEITKNAVKASLKAPRDIDMDLVDAQQARRELDRMVGYKISPLLWAKVKRGLSAGRVQSVALRIVADREAEIDAFIPEEYWSLDAQLKVKGEKRPLTAKFYGTEKKKMTIHSKEEMDEILKKLENEEFQIIDIKNSERTRKAPLPFTTSTLQQEAAKALNFGTQKTMRIAQQLYEGVDIKGNGTVGVITYLRTDSTRISEEADAAARSYIAETYGEAYVAEGTKTKSADKKIQDAHEAIRPTDITRTPAAIKDSLSRDQFRLYQLIWKRFTASRMQPAKYETTAVKIGAGEYCFTVSTARVAFDGFRSVYVEAEEEKEESNVLVGHLSMDSVLTKEEFERRLEAQKIVCMYHWVDLIIEEYRHEDFLRVANGLENEPERGRRCDECIRLRLKKTAEKARELGITKFTTSLVISPHKNFAKITRIAEELAGDLEYIAIDFKKKDGFLKTNTLSKKLGIYRQNYCGCEFSKGHLDKEEIKDGV